MTDKSITITKPDDWHIHLRQGAALQTTVEHAACQFARVIVMPNTVPPIINCEQALSYQSDIISHLDRNYQQSFKPLMTLYLTAQTTPETLKQVASNSSIIACKLYPQGATTNSAQGVSDIQKIYPLFECMQEYNLPLLIHGEVTTDDVDIFDRESIFIEKTLIDIRNNFPELRITLEHITTKDAVHFIEQHQQYTAATITPHHLFLNRNDLLVGGIKPHYYCLPILKDRHNQEAIIKAALSGKPYYFAGSDSAPHAIDKKESACGCAGIYHGPNTVALYAEFFDKHQQLDKLENFISHFGADFYQLPPNQDKITLVKIKNKIKNSYSYEDSTIVPFMCDKELSWSILKD